MQRWIGVVVYVRIQSKRYKSVVPAEGPGRLFASARWVNCSIGFDKRALERQVRLGGDGWSTPGTGGLSAERDKPVDVP